MGAFQRTKSPLKVVGKTRASLLSNSAARIPAPSALRYRYSCAYTKQHLVAHSDAPPAPKRSAVIFERLFGTDDLKVDPATKARRTLLRKSILDVVGDAQKLLGDVGPADRRKLDEYIPVSAKWSPHPNGGNR